MNTVCKLGRGERETAAGNGGTTDEITPRGFRTT
jgi:hypothetical protein